MKRGSSLLSVTVLALGACSATGHGPNLRSAQSAVGIRPDVPVAENASPTYSKRQRGAALLSGGSGYRGSYLQGGTSKGLARATPATQTKTRKARRGAAPLPSGYPLLPGDEALWYSLTAAQQQRALEFLQDGSTIRSSLESN